MSLVNRLQISLESFDVPEKNAHYVVAYSGGVDSHVLLYCCLQLKIPVRAVHVHHGLQAVADEWVNHCQLICKELEIPLDVIHVNARKKHRESPEETARKVRYQALKDSLQQGDCLLTAQHIEDQAETLLLQLLRSASTAGLSAMPEQRQLGNHLHLRPMLFFSRQEIVDFANEHALRWVEDPTNCDTAYDRNFLRQDVVSVLKSRWPEFSRQMATVARLQSKNLQVLDDMAGIDLAQLIMPVKQPVFSFYKVISILSLDGLRNLSGARRSNALRYWIQQSCSNQTTRVSVTRKLLEEIDRVFIDSSLSANPVITHLFYEIRLFKGALYLLETRSDTRRHDITTEISWDAENPLTIPSLNTRLTIKPTTGIGLNRVLRKKPLMIRFRQGGEVFHPADRSHSQRLKKLLQDVAIAPWDRGAIPLLYSGNELIAVIGLWTSRQHTVANGEEGWLIEVSQGQRV